MEGLCGLTSDEKKKDLREREIQQMFLYKICQSLYLYALELNLFISYQKTNFIQHSVSFSVLCISDLE